jgi:hypothetical protein
MTSIPVDLDSIWARTFDDASSSEEAYIYFYAMFILSMRLTVYADSDSDEFPWYMLFLGPVFIYIGLNVILYNCWDKF